eukprot:363243-Chlamydomonas_euryale.AAC.14
MVTDLLVACCGRPKADAVSSRGRCGAAAGNTGIAAASGVLGSRVCDMTPATGNDTSAAAATHATRAATAHATRQVPRTSARNSGRSGRLGIVDTRSSGGSAAAAAGAGPDADAAWAGSETSQSHLLSSSTAAAGTHADAGSTSAPSSLPRDTAATAGATQQRGSGGGSSASNANTATETDTQLNPNHDPGRVVLLLQVWRTNEGSGSRRCACMGVTCLDAWHASGREEGVQLRTTLRRHMPACMAHAAPS